MTQSVMDRLLTTGLCGNKLGQDIQTLTYHSSTSNMAYHLVENSVLLKCRNSEEKTRRLRIRSSAEFLYSMTCVVICSHRRSHLKSFLQGIFIVRIGGGTFFRLRQNIKESINLRAINLTNPHLARTKSFAE